MNKFFILSLASALALAACNHTENNLNKQFWGKKQFYSDFLIKQYNPNDTSHTFRKNLIFDFNQEAKDSLKGDIVFKMVERKVKFGSDGLPKDTLFLPAKDLLLYKDGKLCEDNILRIDSRTERVELKVAFRKDSKPEDYTYNLCLQVVNNGGLDRIGNVDISRRQNAILADEWVLEKDNVYNPFGLLLFWGVVTIIVVLVTWFVISRIVNPKTKFSRLYIDYHDGTGDIRINMGSAYKLVCTNKNIRYSVFSKFFIGVIRVEVKDFWTQPVTITSGRRNTVKVSGISSYELNTDETIRKEPFTLTNENGQGVTITTA